MAVYHTHHIVPKHAGGTDDPSNLIKVTVEEHAELHFARYLQYGELGDWLAAFALSGQISGAEATAEARRDWMRKNGSRLGRIGGKAPASEKAKSVARDLIAKVNSNYPTKVCPHCGWEMRANLLDRHIQSKHTPIKVPLT